MKLAAVREHSHVRLLIVGMVTILATVVLLCTTYVDQLRATMEAENSRYLGEVSQHVAAMVNYRVESTFQALEATAETWADRANEDWGMRYLKIIAEQYGFLRVGVIDREGGIITTDGYDTRLSQLTIVQKVFRGRNAVSAQPRSPLDGREAVIYMVPIWADGVVLGALTATSSKDQMTVLLGADSFDGEGYAQIIDRDGNFVVSSNNKNAPEGERNFFEMLMSMGQPDSGYAVENMRANMAASHSGALYFTIDGVGQSLNYLKLEMEDWYLLSLVPTSAAGEKTQLFIYLAVAANCIIVVLFATLTILIVVLYQRSQNKLEKLAFVDLVTGGMNRTRFELEAAAAIRVAPAGTYALVAMDIQRFKLVNDTFGSEAGNRTLKHVHNVLCRHLRDYELAGRIAADKFNLLVKNGDPVALVARLEAAVMEINAFNDGAARKYFLFMPVGIYVVEDPTLEMVTIQGRANVARKHNKQLRTGRLVSCVFYTDVTRIRMLREKEIDDRKESALAEGEFLIYLQPKIELQHQTLAGAEALVRWADPEHGMVMPDDFVPAFERNGFIIQVDLFVFEEVCALLRRWIDQGVSPIPISVNLSRAHLGNPQFLDPYRAIHQRYQVPPQFIEFELTETLAYEDLAGLVDAIRKIHDMGFGCALDDFGSGYSSLNTLKDIPADVLKLDKAFFDTGDGENDSRGKYVVENVIQLAQKLNMHTVSEGVETLGQLAFLKSARCDLVQGYIFSKPLPVAEFERVREAAQRIGQFQNQESCAVL